MNFIPLMDTFSSGLVNLIRVGFNFPEYYIVTSLLWPNSCEL